MQPAGNTNQAIGLQMGWQSLTASPFTVPAIDPNYQYTQVIILLTDGLNTEDRWYSNASSIDTRQQKTCDNIKAAGITLYRAGQHRQRSDLDDVAELRHRHEQVLPAHGSRPDRHHLQPDRHRAFEPAADDVTVVGAARVTRHSTVRPESAAAGGTISAACAAS
jgi:hypothetical protein